MPEKRIQVSVNGIPFHFPFLKRNIPNRMRLMVPPSFYDILQQNVKDPKVSPFRVSAL